MSNFEPEPSRVVLVVEDEELLRSYVADLLRDAGFEVVEAKDAATALHLLETKPAIRVLFTDIQMPGPLDGMELACKVHKQWPRVLLLITSGNRKPSAADLPDYGHFLAKPFGANEVIEEISALMRQADAR
jgi:DNA-binding response OmpR family regulator